jgi:hypothetical protein
VPRPLVVGYVTFKGHVKANVYHAAAPTAQRFAPHMVVDRLYYRTGANLNTPPWMGFSHSRRLGCGR